MQGTLNMKVNFDKTNILEYDGGPDNEAFAQLPYCLEPKNPYFEIKVLDIGEHEYISLGLSCRKFLGNGKANWGEPFISYRSYGKVFLDGKCLTNGLKWEKGDIVKCGIEFPDKFLNDGKTDVQVSFWKNNETVSENCSMKMPIDWLFPTVSIRCALRVAVTSKIEYLSM